METVRIRAPGWKKVESGIRDKHPGSATLIDRATKRKGQGESWKKMALLSLTWFLTLYRWSHQEKRARRKLQEDGAAVTDMVSDIERDRVANRKVLGES